MALTIQCFEPSMLPPRVAVEAPDGARVTVYLVDNNASEGASLLRDTVIRVGDDLPPSGATFLVSMLVVEADRTRLPLLRVDRPRRVLPLDLLRADSRARVAMGTDLRTGARFELTLLDRRTVSFSLHFSADATRGSRALVGSGGTRGRAAASTTRTALWLLPSLWQIWTDPLDEVQDWARAKLVTFGLSTSMLVLLMTVWVPIAAGGWFAWGQRTAVVDAKASAEAALGSASAANAGRDAALEAEATCMSQRTDLARALGDTLAEREARVDAALEASAARAFALELGGARLATPELARVEEDSLGRIRERLVKELGDSPPLPEEALRCTAANAALEKDLPAWVLLWHPDARVVCPLDFDSEAGGVHQRGSWGLSDRILRQFGPPSAEGDARLVDRLAANMFTKGLRAVRAAILAAPTGERPPVAPAELHLWTVTLWDAYNRMPSPAAAVLDEPAATCVSALLTALANAEDAAPPGLPVLHDLVDFAEDRTVFTPPATAGCSWPEDGLPEGARAALRAVARGATVPRGEATN